jgi:hypothetical protein
MNNPMMKCGHRANATQNNKPCCVICAGFGNDWNTPAPEPDLSKRECICLYCKKVIPSSEAVAFFEYKPNEKYDQHYCGCRGWN